MKIKLYLILIVLVLVLTLFGYYWLSGIIRENEQAKAVLSDSEKYQMIKKSISDETDRCEKFISQSQGDFGSFEYCKKFIDWTNSQQTIK